jgi:hypothetical protein
MVVAMVFAQAVKYLAVPAYGVHFPIGCHALQIAVYRGDADMRAPCDEPIVHGLRCGEGVVFLQLFLYQRPRPGDSMHHMRSALPAKPEVIPFARRHTANRM